MKQNHPLLIFQINVTFIRICNHFLLWFTRYYDLLMCLNGMKYCHYDNIGQSFMSNIDSSILRRLTSSSFSCIFCRSSPSIWCWSWFYRFCRYRTRVLFIGFRWYICCTTWSLIGWRACWSSIPSLTTISGMLWLGWVKVLVYFPYPHVRIE